MLAETAALNSGESKQNKAFKKVFDLSLFDKNSSTGTTISSAALLKPKPFKTISQVLNLLKARLPIIASEGPTELARIDRFVSTDELDVYLQLNKKFMRESWRTENLFERLKKSGFEQDWTLDPDDYVRGGVEGQYHNREGARIQRVPSDEGVFLDRKSTRLNSSH